MNLQKGETTAQTALLIAKSFIGKPYKAGTLEGNSKEQLVCNLRDFDCSTFVENVVAMSIVKNAGSATFEKYKKQLTELRYRNGIVKGYASRLHYFKEWMIQAEQNDILVDITSKIGGIKQKKSLNFMTSNRELYPNLKDEAAYLAIKDYQKQINESEFYYIPKWKLEKVENQIQDGDIIAITSNVDGLDFNHEGFAIRQNGRIYLLHASYEVKKIIISKELLVDYLNRIHKHSGISVLRLL
ncbi:MAG: DUF1460 domain-containing protein [Emticicia sp.]|nr:DUF1460 domain-containing protein [Emticicia sp.]